MAFNQEQIKQLLQNQNVIKCSKTSITYSPAFKTRAVKEYYEEGNSPNTIFQQAGFDLRVIGRGKPKACLKRWRSIYKAKGETGLHRETRGKYKKPKEAVPESTNYLKAKIAYLEAENDFLRNLKTKTKP